MTIRRSHIQNCVATAEASQPTSKVAATFQICCIWLLGCQYKDNAMTCLYIHGLTHIFCHTIRVSRFGVLCLALPSLRSVASQLATSTLQIKIKSFRNDGQTLSSRRLNPSPRRISSHLNFYPKPDPNPIPNPNPNPNPNTNPDPNPNPNPNPNPYPNINEYGSKY